MNSSSELLVTISVGGKVWQGIQRASYYLNFSFYRLQKSWVVAGQRLDFLGCGWADEWVQFGYI